MKEQAPTLVIEATSVVFAVLLALAINEWRQGREQAEIAREALARIRTEITQNHAKLAGALAEQSAALDALGVTIERLSAGETESTTLEFNFRAEQVRDAAWQTALLTQAVRFIDFEVVSQAADVYELQGLVNAGVQRVLDRMATIGAGDEQQVVSDLRLLQGAASQLLSLEDQLVQRYEAFLESPGS